MPTPAELYTEITSGPLAAELVEPWASGDDTGVTGVLNRADRSGYVPPGFLLKWLTGTGLLAVFDLIAVHRLVPPADPTQPATVVAPFGLYALAVSLRACIGHNLRASIAEISTGSDALVAAGLMTPDQKTAVLALEQKVSRAQEAWGYDARVSESDVSAARKAGG